MTDPITVDMGGLLMSWRGLREQILPLVAKPEVLIRAGRNAMFSLWIDGGTQPGVSFSDRRLNFNGGYPLPEAMDALNPTLPPFTVTYDASLPDGVVEGENFHAFRCGALP